MTYTACFSGGIVMVSSMSASPQSSYRQSKRYTADPAML
jgi:hypothetical protein